MSSIEDYQSILNMNDPISGSDNQLPLSDLGEKEFIHRIYPYRFFNKDTIGFGKVNTTLVVGITNKLFDKEFVDNLNIDTLGNPFFNIDAGFNLTSKFEVNRDNKSYSINIVNVESFSATTSEYFTTKSLDIDPNTNLLVVDESYMMCFTIDEPFDEQKVANNEQHVYFINDYHSNLDDENMKFVNKHKDEIIEDQFSISMSFIHSYVFATTLHNFKFSFTSLDMRKISSKDYDIKISVNNYAMINKVDIKTSRQGYFKNEIEDIELKVQSDLVPFKAFPNEVSDSLTMKGDWLDFDYMSPLNFLYRLYPRDKNGALLGDANIGSNGTITDYKKWDSNSGGEIANMFLDPLSIGIKNPTFVTYGKEALMALADMINMSKLTANKFSELALITDTNSVNYGGLDPTSRIGYAQPGLGSLNKGSNTSDSLVDSVYLDFIISNNLTPKMEIWKLFHCAIALLSQYIKGGAAIAGGINKFGNIFSPWYLNLIDSISLQNWKYGTEGSTDYISGTRFNIVFPGGEDSSKKYDASGGTVQTSDIMFFGNPFWNNGFAKVIVGSEWFNIIQNDSTITPVKEFKIEPIRNHIEIDKLQIKKSQGTVTFPIVGDRAVAIPRSAIPSDISTSDNIDLSYITWIDLPLKPQNIPPPKPIDINAPFDKFYQKAVSYKKVAKDTQYLIPSIKFYRKGKSSGVFPLDDAEQKSFLITEIARMYRVPESAVKLDDYSNHYLSRDDGATQQIGFWWTAYRQGHGNIPFTWTTIKHILTGKGDVSTQHIDPIFQNKSLFRINLFPTISIPPFNPMNGKLYVEEVNLKYWIDQACNYISQQHGGANTIDMLPKQLKVFVADYFSYDYTPHAADPTTPQQDQLPYVIEPYTGSNLEKGTNPGIRGHWYSHEHWGGHAQFNLTPMVYVFSNVKVTITVPTVIVTISNKLTYFNKKIWLDTRVHDYDLPMGKVDLKVLPSKYEESFKGINELIIKGFFIDYVELIIQDTKNPSHHPKIVYLPMPQDLDDTITVHRFSFI